MMHSIFSALCVNFKIIINIVTICYPHGMSVTTTQTVNIYQKATLLYVMSLHNLPCRPLCTPFDTTFSP